MVEWYLRSAALWNSAFRLLHVRVSNFFTLDRVFLCSLLTDEILNGWFIMISKKKMLNVYALIWVRFIVIRELDKHANVLL